MRTHHVLEGPAGAPVVVLIHPLGVTLRLWDRTAAALAGAGFRVLRYDVRGHGGSETPPGPYALEQMADDARELLDALGLGDVHVVGMSMGGLPERPQRARSTIESGSSQYASLSRAAADVLRDEAISSAPSARISNIMMIR
jgi:predicted alpha/beta-fold hydrolase